MRKNSIYASLLAIVSLPLVSSCGSDVAWCGTKELHGNGWEREHAVEFAIPQRDSLLWQSRKEHDVIACLRYSRKCDLEEIRLAIEQESLESEGRCDTITVRLYDKSGRPLHAVNSPLFESYDTLAHHTRIPEGYRLSISPVVPETIPGISAVTLLIK